MDSPYVRRLSSDDVRHDVRRERENECSHRSEKKTKNQINKQTTQTSTNPAHPYTSTTSTYLLQAPEQDPTSQVKEAHNVPQQKS